MAEQTVQPRRTTVIDPQGLQKWMSVFASAVEELASYFLIMGRSIQSGISEESIKKAAIHWSKFSG